MDNRQAEQCRIGFGVGLQAARPAWLIDTQNLCLVLGELGKSYIALSYVWGITPFFETTKATISQLQDHGAFQDGRSRLEIPRTILDAIEFAPLLEERYLWVDSLCIVQDDEETRASQLNNMASIFANAYATIVTRTGEDTNYGSRGLKGISSSSNESSLSAGERY